MRIGMPVRRVLSPTLHPCVDTSPLGVRGHEQARPFCRLQSILTLIPHCLCGTLLPTLPMRQEPVRKIVALYNYRPLLIFRRLHLPRTSKLREGARNIFPRRGSC